MIWCTRKKVILERENKNWSTMIQVNPFCKPYMSPVSVSKNSCVICAKFKASLLFVINIFAPLFVFLCWHYTLRSWPRIGHQNVIAQSFLVLSKFYKSRSGFFLDLYFWSHLWHGIDNLPGGRIRVNKSAVLSRGQGVHQQTQNFPFTEVVNTVRAIQTFEIHTTTKSWADFKKKSRPTRTITNQHYDNVDKTHVETFYCGSFYIRNSLRYRERVLLTRRLSSVYVI